MEKNESIEKIGSDNIATITVFITGMSCKACSRRIESALSEIPGVDEIVVNLADQKAKIRLNPSKVSLDILKSTIEALGYGILENAPNDEIETGPAKGQRSYQGFWPYPFLIGVAAALGIVGFYLGFLTLTSDWYNARLEFAQYGWWILALAVGLGIQATLYSLLRIRRQSGSGMKGATSSLAASGGMSTASMAACCAHYLVAFLPAIGLPFLSAAAAGLAQYRTQFFLVGILSNLFGIGLMFRLFQKNGIIPNIALWRLLTPGAR